MSADDDFPYELAAARAELAWLAFELALVKFTLALKANFNPDQPRVPAGRPDGGRWTGDGGSSSKPRSEREFAPLILAGDIAGFTRHGINQTITRGVSPAAMLDALRNPLRVMPQPNGTTRYVGQHAVVVLNPFGFVVTVWPQ